MTAPATNIGDRWLRELAALYRLLRHPRTPWYARAIAACAVGYVFSPVQLIPSFIPVIGQLDDVAVLFVGSRLVRVCVNPALLAECDSGPPPRRTIGLLAAAAVLGAAILALAVHSTG